MGEPHALSRLPYTLDELVTIIKVLQMSKYEPSRFTPEQIAILKRLNLLVGSNFEPNLNQRIGENLYRVLMVSDVGTAFQMCLNQVRPTKGTITLQLCFDEDATELAQYPWELLYHRRALLPSGNVELIRYITYSEAITALPVIPPLRLLYIQSRPSNLRHLDDSEREVVYKSLAELEAKNLLKVDKLPRPTYDGLLDYLEANRVHILHFDGHGTFAWQCPKCGAMNQPFYTSCQASQENSLCNQINIGLKPQGYLAFERENHLVDWISSEDLGYLFDKHPLYLAVLSACRSGSVGGETLFGGTAPALIQAGVPAIVSTQFPISVDAATKFLKSFYQALARFESLPAAVNAGRLRIIRTNEWFVPVLYLRTRDNEGHIFTRT